MSEFDGEKEIDTRENRDKKQIKIRKKERNKETKMKKKKMKSIRGKDWGRLFGKGEYI